MADSNSRGRSAMSARYAVFAAAVALLTSFAAEAQRVGTASAVNPETTANGRVLSIGSEINFGETIKTSANGSAQIISADKTTLSIGPNSTVKIDEFVYSPRESSGRMSINLVKGALRVVGGDVTHNGTANVKTPVATVGIRGGVASISHGNNTQVYNHYGNVSVNSGGQTQNLYRSGFGVTAGGGQITPPGRGTPGQINGMAGNFISRSGQTGGLSRPPTEAGLRTAGVFGNTFIGFNTPAQNNAPGTGTTPGQSALLLSNARNGPSGTVPALSHHHHHHFHHHHRHHGWMHHGRRGRGDD